MADTESFAVPPTPSELDTLAVFWQAAQEGEKALKLGDVFKRVSERRQQAGLEPPAITTVSSMLRSLTGKRFLEEVRLRPGTESDEPTREAVIRARGMFAPTRSPHTAYTAKEISEVLGPTFRGLSELYPNARRHEALIDFARATGLSEKVVKKLAEVLKKEA